MGILTQVVGIGALTWLLWSLLRDYVSRSSLDNIPGPKPSSFTTGHFGEFMMSRDAWPFMREISDKFNGVAKLQAVLGEKFLYISDPAAVYTMFVKEPTGFEHTSEFLTGNTLLFGSGLGSTSGDTHRKQRRMITPAFSLSHLRQLTPVFVHVAETLRNAIATQVKDHPKADVNVASWSSRAALEIVGQGGMGYSFDPLIDTTPNEYANALKNLMPTLFSIALHWFFIPWSVFLGPPQFRRWLLDLYPNTNAQKLKVIVDTCWQKATSIVADRKVALETGDEDAIQRVGGGKDIMSILLRANMNASKEDRLPYEQLVAQVNTLVFAASDTTSNALSRVLHTLVIHSDAQERLRQEIRAFRESGEELTYDKLIELPYLDAVCKETLRVYPTVLAFDRIALRDTVLPLHKPIDDVHGNPITEIPITKGTLITVGIYTYNRRRDVWGEDADEWKPERWLSSLPERARNTPSGSVFSNMMTFAAGPRSCIGFKYAELELKTFLFFLIESFKFSQGATEIIWNTSFVVFPSVSKESSKSEMPLRVELVQ
ncbi:hypothetical protein EUX98_g6892 [Antrodiella citrinella]|uniref:Cytochrome P450 n=1 Tax=Antrodiella citrinella TaxID=2447956 RepID=A0A4S4MN57_9APHY|nr:hypothetical protein EUX98_g6892 [Antrodiella citrinella]